MPSKQSEISLCKCGTPKKPFRSLCAFCFEAKLAQNDRKHNRRETRDELLAASMGEREFQRRLFVVG